MRILALYDIHGNVDALEAVLAEHAASECDLVVIGGDAVPGAFAAVTLDRLDALQQPVRRLRGNGEREVAEALAGSEPTGRDPIATEPAASDIPAVTAAITAREIGRQRALELGALPLTLELDGVLFCHASPRRDDEMLTRLSRPERWRDALSGVDARLVVGGHTHQQDDRVVELAGGAGVRFVNAGSVGMPYEGDGAARWLRIVDGVPELRSTSYDAAAAGARILAAGWPDSDSIEASLIDPIDPLVVTQAFEGLARGEGEA